MIHALNNQMNLLPCNLCPRLQNVSSHAISPSSRSGFPRFKTRPMQSVFLRERCMVPCTSTATSSEQGPSGQEADVPIERVSWPPGVQDQYWDWTVPGSTLETRIRYVQAGDQGPPLLLLHGFGVGSYHFERNMAELSRSCRVYAVDILGQGSSWPVRPPTGEDLLYISVDTWRAQLRDFVEQVMNVHGQDSLHANGDSGNADGLDSEHVNGTYVAGNSLGGLLAVHLAAAHPGLVRGLVLLNATPFWSFRPPLSAVQQGIWAMLPKGFGSIPVPTGLKGFIERVWWNTLRKPQTVRRMLQLVYKDRASVDEETVNRILQATQRPMALDVFSAIALAPQPELDFEGCLAKVAAPILMLYGRDDPWVVPLWGQRLKAKYPKAVYLELSPAGHCPHHEVPKTVNWAMLSWIMSGGSHAPVPEGDSLEIEEAPGRVVRVVHRDGRPNTAPTNLISKVVAFFEDLRGKMKSQGNE